MSISSKITPRQAEATEVTLKLSVKVKRRSQGNGQGPGGSKVHTESAKNQLTEGDESLIYTQESTGNTVSAVS